MKTYSIYNSMKSIARFISILLLICVAVGNAWGASIPFSETFNSCSGTGGNDGSWSGNIASSSITADNTGWSFSSKAYGGKQCTRLGNANNKGSATTPSITVVNGNNYTLSFESAPWDQESGTMTVTVTGGTINSNSSATTGTMTVNKWNEYEFTITATSTSLTIAFTSSQNRFFLNKVSIVNAAACTTIPEIGRAHV